ncbi:MAG: translation initiation factor IF-5A [Candidatus Nanoarchaeia archaeon]
MPLKLVNATELRQGSYVNIEGEACQVKSVDVSKTGKHGHAKCRIEAISILGGKKKVLVVPGHERFEVPMIDKRKAQVLSIIDNKANIMDSDNYENLELDIPEDLQGEVKEGMNIEYWDIEGQKIIKRTL